MTLPTLNEHPKHTMTIPSTGKEVRYRPFLVKEEKVLLMAMETKDNKEIFKAIMDTIDACVENGVPQEDLTTFDVEYMFIQIRAKSVGETTNLNMKCEKCEKTTPIDVALDDIEIDVPVFEKMIEIDKDVTVEVSWPSYFDVVQHADLESATEQTFALIRSSMIAVHSGDDRTLVKDEDRGVVEHFLGQMTKTQFNKITDFVSSVPSVEKEVSFTCEHCFHDNKVVLKGMTDFFT